MTTLTLRDAVEVVLEGYTLHEGARKILETAIAQELASQSANTNPVVSQKTSGAVDKDCDTCNNRHKRMHQEPCFSCHGYTNWEPKP